MAEARRDPRPPAGFGPEGDSSRRCRAAVLGLFLLLIAGCGSSGKPPFHYEQHPFTAEEQELWSAAQDARYRLQVGDVFQVDFKYQDELDSDQLVILPDGRFTMSGVEDVRAAGLTIPELDDLLTRRFAQDFKNPELAIIIRELGPQPVYVLGEVNKPGSYSLPATGGGVLQAISMAGGFTNLASTSQVLVARVTPEGFLYQVFDLSHLEKQGIRGLEQLFLRPNDIVYVPRSTLGDLRQFSQLVLEPLLRAGTVFWDVWALFNLDKVDRVVR